jgi:hypothetical protein
MCPEIFTYTKRLFIMLTQISNVNWAWKLMPVILATQEAEIRRIVVRSQPREIVQKTLC